MTKSPATPARTPAAPPRTGIWTVLRQALRPVVAAGRLLLLGMVGLIVAAVLLELAPPLLLRAIVDDHLKQGLTQGLWRLAWLYLAATVGARVAGFAQAYLTAVFGQRILLRLRLLVAGKLEALPLSYFDRTPVGEIMSRCTSDVEAVNALFTSGAIGLVTDLFRIVGVSAAMFALSPALAAGTLLVVPVVGFLTEYFRRHIRAAQRLVRVAVASITAQLQEALSGARVLHVFGQAQRALERVSLRQTEYHRAADRAALHNSYFPGVLETMRAATIAVVLWLAAQRAAPGSSITVGDLAAFVLLIGRLFSPIQELSQEFQTIQEAMAGVERLAEVLGEPEEDRHGADAREAGQASGETAASGRGRLVVRDLSFRYETGRQVLSDISFTLAPGERVAIVGRTGAGKTTLLHLIAGLYRPQAGVLEVDGRAPIALDPAERRRLLGVVPQTVQLFPGTVRDNVTLSDRSITADQVRRALTLVGADGFVAELPDGLDTVLGPGGTSLSFGQGQIICLARALVCYSAGPPSRRADLRRGFGDGSHALCGAAGSRPQPDDGLRFASPVGPARRGAGDSSSPPDESSRTGRRRHWRPAAAGIASSRTLRT